MNLKELGARIKERREKRRLRQSDIANALRVSAQAVSKWERGENAPDIALLVGLARLLDVNLEWLLGGSPAVGDTFEATVFCTSLNGYAERAATMPPRDLAAWINSIDYALTEAVLRKEGVPIKYVGDGFLAFFSGVSHAQRGIEAALQARMMLTVQELMISLHAGPIYLGMVGHPDYQRPDIMGQTVNTAFLVMPWASQQTGEVTVVTEAVKKALQEADAFRLELLDRVELLGNPEPIELYRCEHEVT